VPAANWTVLALAPRGLVAAPTFNTLTALAVLGLTLFAMIALSAYRFGRAAAKVARSLGGAAAQLGRGEIPEFAVTPVRDVNAVGEALAAAGIGLREREAALRDNASYLRRVLDNLIVFVAVLDREGALREINAAPLRLTGLAREDLVGRKFWELPWWNENAEAQARVREAVAVAGEGRISRFDVAAHIREGVDVIVDLQLAPLRDAAGKVVAIIPSAIDVSEREQATRDLRENAERLRLALLAGRLGAWDLDIAANVCIYSERTQEMFGVATTRLTREEFRALLHPDDRPHVATAIRETIETDAPYRVEFRVVRPDGEMRWIDSQALAQRDETGKAVRLIGVHQDISERRQREEELRSNIELLRIIGETTPDLIVVKDAQGRYRFVNPAMARILGKEQADLVGASSLDGALDPQEAALLHANDMRIMDEGRSQTVEESMTVPGGATRIYLSTKTPMRDRFGTVVGLVGVSTDITDRKRAEERQATMVRELHHRVKNSLATVQAIANSTARTATDIESFREAFNQRVISLARTHTLLAENSWGVIPLRELLVAELEPYGGSDEMRVTMRGPDVALPSDVALSLGMAVHELTTNAFKYGALSSAEGAIHIEWSVESVESSRRLQFLWKETGGPAVATPGRQGFGSRLLRHMLGGQFSGDVQMAFEPDGLRFSVTVPLVERAEAPGQAAQ
jgi:PAS domain S-box-containing protein